MASVAVLGGLVPQPVIRRIPARRKTRTILSVYEGNGADVWRRRPFRWFGNRGPLRFGVFLEGLDRDSSSAFMVIAALL